MTTYHPPPETLESADQFYTCMRDFYTFLDSQISNYIAREQLAVACSKGCGICCYIKLDVNAHEILYLAHHIRTVLSDEIRAKVIADLKESAKTIAPLSARDHILGRFKCGFLQDNCCAIHPARPSMCRKYNSISLEGCRQIFSIDAQAPVQGPEDSGLAKLAINLIKTFDSSFKAAGYDKTEYEINQAVLIALEEHGCMQRWLAGDKILPSEVEAKKFSQATIRRLFTRQKSSDISDLTSSQKTPNITT